MELRPYEHAAPAEVREKIRKGLLRTPTAGMCAGYAQANLVVLPGDAAEDFWRYAQRNPRPCPVLEIIRETPETRFTAKNGNIMTDIPEYYVYRNGVLAEKLADASALWQPDYVGFLIGCSFSFEEALLRAGIPVRHIEEGRNVPMYKTNRMTIPAGPFSGPMVCSMRPMTPEQAALAAKITAAMPNVHGAPEQIGDAAGLGIRDLGAPDYGDAVEVRQGEVPVFWPCGVTPQAAVEQAKLPLVITHSPGHMFVTDLRNDTLNEQLEARKEEDHAAN